MTRLLLFTVACFMLNFEIFGQFTGPVVVENINTFTTPIRVLADVDATQIGSSPIGHKWVAKFRSYTPADEDFQFYWYKIDVPGKFAMTEGYVSAGFSNITGEMLYMEPQCTSDYVQITGDDVLIRVTAGGTIITIDGLNAHLYNGQKFATTGLTSIVGGVTWYQIYLPTNCSNTLGYVSGTYATFFSSGLGTCTNPNNPTSVSALALSTTQIKLSWTAPASGSKDGYVVYNCSPLYGLGYYTTSNTITIEGLLPNTFYSFKLKTYNMYGVSTGTSCVSATTLPICEAPTTQASQIDNGIEGTNSITFDWDEGNGERTIVKINTINSFTNPSNGTDYTGNTVYSGTGQQVVYHGTAGSVTVTGLNPNTEYWFKAFESNCTGSNTKYSTATGSDNPDSFVTLESCSSPSASVADNSGTGSVTLNCNVTGGAGGSILYKWYENSSCTGTAILGATSSSFTTSTSGNYSCKAYISGFEGTCFDCDAGYATVITPMPPVISTISTTDHNINAGENVTLSAVVTGGPTSYNWTIKGGTPYSTLTATGANPTITLNKPGSYKVTLVASNGAGASAPFTTVSNFITVKSTPLTLAKPPKNAVVHNLYTNLIGDPVNTGTGSYEYNHTDIKFSGLLNDVTFTRYYSSVNKDVDGPLGFGWSHNFNYYIQDQDSIWIVHHGDGHFSYYIPLFDGEGNSFPLYGGTNEVLKKDGLSGLFTLSFKTGEIYQFNSENNISSAVDFFGNTTNFTYLENNLISVMDPGGRYFNFSYTAGKMTDITDPIARNIHFNYDGFGNLVNVTNAKGGLLNYNYSDHQIITIVDPRGNTAISNTYENGVIISQFDALNNETTFLYDTITVDRITTITWPDNSFITLIHDSIYRLMQEVDELGFIKNYTYNPNNDRTSFADENGYVTSFTYDTLGNTTSVTTPDGNTTSIEYYIYSKPKKITTPVGDSINFVYYPDITDFYTFAITEFGRENNASYNTYGQVLNFSHNNPTAIVDSFNVFGDLTHFADGLGKRYHNLEYDGVGRLVKFTDGLEHNTEFTYSATDKLTAIIDHFGDSISYVYDENDNLIKITDKKGIATNYKYDKKNRLDSIVNCYLAVKSFEYDERDNVINVKDEENRIIEYEYDPRNLLSTITNSLGSTTISYEPARHLSSVTIPSGGVYTIEYDLLYNKIAIVDPEMNRTEYTYNDLNHITEIKDALGNTTTYQYYRTGEIKNIIDAMDNITSYTYDAWGRLSSITDANSHTQTFDEYDEYNLLTKKTDASGKIYTYEYDKAGNLITESTYWGTVTRSYDPLNRLSIMHVGDDTYQYEYDPNGNITQVISLTGIENYTFTNLNQIAIHTDVYGNSTSNLYDNVGNRIYIQYSGGLGIQYNYNDANLLSSVVDWNNDTTSYSYNSDGQVTDMVYPNGISCNYSYDGAGRMVEKFISLDSSIYFHSILALDPVGNIISEERTGPIPSHISGYKPRIYHSPPFPEASYYNDTISYSYSNNNKLLTAGDFSWSASAMSEHEGWPGTSNYYRYREDGLLIDYRKSMDILLEADTKYTYDGFRNRIKTTFGTDQKRFVIDNNSGLGQVLEEQDATGAVKVQYIYGLGLIGRIDSAGQILYYLSDASHNIFALSDDSAQITDTYIIDPFGTVFEHDGPTVQPYTFLGEFGVQQEDSLFYYVRERYYHSGMGRFLTPDPYPADLMNPQTLNEYIYGFNNPLINFDPSGLFAWNSYGISILQFYAAVGHLAQIGVMLKFRDYNPISLENQINDFSKYLNTSVTNYNKAITNDKNWVASDQMIGIREKYINNSTWLNETTYSEIVKLNNTFSLITGNAGFTASLKLIPENLKYYSMFRNFTSSSLLISGGKSILYLNDFFNTAQSFKNCK